MYSHGNAWTNLHLLGQPNTSLAASAQRLDRAGLGPMVHDRAGRGLPVIGVCGLRPGAAGLCCHIPWVMKDAFTVLFTRVTATFTVLPHPLGDEGCRHVCYRSAWLPYGLS